MAGNGSTANIEGLEAPARLHDADRAAIAAHLRRLNAADRALRFERETTDEAIDAFVARLDLAAHVLLGIRDGDGEVVALAHACPFHDAAGPVFEAAFSTDEAWRRRGLGQLLFAEVIDRAHAAGCHRVVAQCLARNRPMRGLLAAFGAACETADGEVFGEIRLGEAAR